jgi:hypothetical protein
MPNLNAIAIEQQLVNSQEVCDFSFYQDHILAGADFLGVLHSLLCETLTLEKKTIFLGSEGPEVEIS